MQTNLAELVDELEQALAAVAALDEPLEAESAVFHRRSASIELTYRTTSHQLPPNYFALHRRLRSALGDRVLVRIVQPDHVEMVRSSGSVLSRCVKDCCVLLEPI